jgi:hypothetical protein
VERRRDLWQPTAAPSGLIEATIHFRGLYSQSPRSALGGDPQKSRR